MSHNESETKKTAVPLVDAVSKALEILDCFTARETELSLNQLCDKTELYKSRVHRLCGTLITCGYLVRTSRTNYRLGPKLMVLGKVYEKSNTLRSIAAPIMKKLTQETGESTALFVVDGHKCICMTREMGHSRLVYSINEGDYMELTPTAAGRVLLAYADSSFINRVLAKFKPKMFTEATKTNVEEIKAELETIRKRGYGINQQEREEGISALAAPVFDFENSVPAALAIVGSSYRFKEESRQALLEKLLDATHEMSHLMGEY